LGASLACRPFRALARAIAAGSLLALAAGLSTAQLKLPYGSRAGMTTTVLAKEGLDTEHAVIMVKHTREDAEGYCISYVDDPTPECVSRTLAEVKLADRVTANCKSGEFTSLDGDRYRFEGLAKHTDGHRTRAKHIVRELSNDEIADGSLASGYLMNMAVFRALCPSTAPTDD
jgi:hypothetical protein